MFWTQCGVELQAQDRSCSQCGKARGAGLIGYLLAWLVMPKEDVAAAPVFASSTPR